MSRATRTQQLRDGISIDAQKLDNIDLEIVSLLVSGSSNKEISKSLAIPLSTVQRRTRKVFERNFVARRFEPNYKLLGYSKGLLHMFVGKAETMLVAKQLWTIPGITRVSIHIGNSDIVGDFVYRNSAHVLEAITRAKQIMGVERVIWSEEVLEVPVNNGNSKLTPELS